MPVTPSMRIAKGSTTIDYTDRLLVTYAANMARRLDYPSLEACKLLKEVGMGDGFQHARECDATRRFIEFVTEVRLSRVTWEKFRKAMDELSQAVASVSPNLLARRVQRLGEYLELTREDVLFLEMWLFLSDSYGIQRLLEFVAPDAWRDCGSYSMHVTNCYVAGRVSGGGAEIGYDLRTGFRRSTDTELIGLHYANQHYPLAHCGIAMYSM